MKKLWLAVLCRLGIHLSGNRSAGCMYNINVCDHCKRDVWHVWKESE